MKFYNSKNLKKARLIYTFMGDNDEWCATTEERKWCGSFAINDYRTLAFKEEMKIDARFEELIDKMTGNYYEIYGVETFFDKDKDVRINILLNVIEITNGELNEDIDTAMKRIYNFTKGYNLARRIYGEA